jgi:hypothetical protein
VAQALFQSEGRNLRRLLDASALRQQNPPHFDFTSVPR